MALEANITRLTPFALWRSRLPASIGNWFARDLSRAALALADEGHVTLRAVENAKIEASVSDRGGVTCGIEWATGTGPQALRSVCTCGSTGVCEHVVATLETVRRADEAPHPADPADADIDLSWLPAADSGPPRARARSVWPVISSSDGKTLTGALYLDTPRLRGVIRDAESILGMMESTPADDWDDADRELIRDEAVQEAFGTRVSQRALARALFRLARHPRTRFDDQPGANRHPIELSPFDVDVRGVRLRAVRSGDHFVPALERADGRHFTPRNAIVVDGPPAWLVNDRTAYLLDGRFDPKRVIAAADAIAKNGSSNGTTNGKRPSIGTIARVAPFLSAEDRHELGVVDAQSPGAIARLRWTDGALVARLGFVDRATGATAPFSLHGSVAATAGRFVRFAPTSARALGNRFLEAGFVPRGGDSFALHDVERAALFVRETVHDWDDIEVQLDDSLSTVAAGESAIDVSISARKDDADGERDWFELSVDVFVGDGDALTPKELAALLQSSGRYAEVRGKLFDVEALRSRRTLLAELNDRRRTGMAALVALHDEIHEAFGDVALPEEVEHLRERLRNFEGVEHVNPPEAVAAILRDYQRQGLDFLDYLRSFKFGGILADDMGLGKSVQKLSLILTPSGWRIFGDIQVGDEVMNSSGGISRVTGVFPQGQLEGYRVYFADGASVVCSDDHLWAVNSAVRKKRGQPYRVMTLHEIREDLRDAAGNAKHSIPIAEPMHFGNTEPLPVEPYLLGCLLGDGGISQNDVRLTSADEEVLEQCRALVPTGTDVVYLSRFDYAFRPSIDESGLRSTHTLRNALTELDLMGCNSSIKFVPQRYLVAGLSERLSLLQGLMDTDGCITEKDGHVEFTSVSQGLADAVCFLVRSLGGVARLRYEAEPKYTDKVEKRTGKPAYRVSVALPPEFNPFRLTRKAEAYRRKARTKYVPGRAIVKVEPVGMRDMQCISVDSPDHLFIVDDFILTHNTLQVIAQLLHRKEVEGPSPSLVIAPTSVTHTWENEIARFAPQLSTLRLQSGADRAARYADVPKYDVVITSYALARLDAEQLERFNFRSLILDEAQNAKNPSSQIAKVVRNLRADHRLALTGTPVENSLRDLWSIFAFVEPGLLGSEASFRRRFENPISEGDETAAHVLRSRLEPFVLRRTKEDVARELPERTEQIIECDLSPLQRRLYRGIAEAARRDVLAQIDDEGGMEGATVHVLAALTRLRQVCAHPGLIMPEYIDEPEASGKFDAFLETVEEVLSGGHKVLVFSAFASMLKIMRTALQKRDVNFGYLDGATKDRDRQAEVERFMSADGPPVFLCSLKAGGVGLTLTAADYVILYDPWWNPAVERQAIDRTHRIGQTRPVTAYRMVTAGSVEEKIRALAERKSALSRSVIKADSAIAKALTKDDLEFLFADPI
jgi:superfamily II DNA or RNA helicase